MRNILRLLPVLACLFAFNAKAQKTSVRIRVSDEQNLALPGASITLSPGNNGGYTNSNGEVTFGALPAGDYHLTISYIGFATLPWKKT